MKKIHKINIILRKESEIDDAFDRHTHKSGNGIKVFKLSQALTGLFLCSLLKFRKHLTKNNQQLIIKDNYMSMSYDNIYKYINIHNIFPNDFSIALEKKDLIMFNQLGTKNTSLTCTDMEESVIFEFQNIKGEISKLSIKKQEIDDEKYSFVQPELQYKVGDTKIELSMLNSLLKAKKLFAKSPIFMNISLKTFTIKKSYVISTTNYNTSHYEYYVDDKIPFSDVATIDISNLLNPSYTEDSLTQIFIQDNNLFITLYQDNIINFSFKKKKKKESNKLLMTFPLYTVLKHSLKESEFSRYKELSCVK